MKNANQMENFKMEEITGGSGGPYEGNPLTGMLDTYYQIAMEEKNRLPGPRRREFTMKRLTICCTRASTARATDTSEYKQRTLRERKRIPGCFSF